jgi:hypothetical protein
MLGLESIQSGLQEALLPPNGALVCNRCLLVLKDARSASMRISLAPKTYPAGKERDWAMLSQTSLLRAIPT